MSYFTECANFLMISNVVKITPLCTTRACSYVMKIAINDVFLLLKISSFSECLSEEHG